MPFLKDYKYDLFISYRRPDNPTDAPWVTRFHSVLTSILIPPGPNDPLTRPKIFFDDKSIQGNDALSLEVKDAAANSALFLVVMSERYVKLDSKWCELERKCFGDAVSGKPLGANRFFIINIGNVANEEWPRQFSDATGYQFWVEDGGVPVPMSLDFSQTGTYPGVLKRLCTDILSTLRSLLPQRRRWLGHHENRLIEQIDAKMWEETSDDTVRLGKPYRLRQIEVHSDYVELRRDDGPGIHPYDIRLYENRVEVRDRDNGWRFFRPGRWDS